jgi:hypothetical protein
MKTDAEIKQICHAFANHKDSFSQQANTMINLFSVFRTSIEQMGLDKLSFLNKLSEMQKITELMSDFLKGIAGELSAIEAAIEEANAEATKQPTQKYPPQHFIPLRQGVAKMPPVGRPNLQQTRRCPTCGNPLQFISQYQKWYCKNCKRYV